jgi:hypothetical protein
VTKQMCAVHKRLEVYYWSWRQGGTFEFAGQPKVTSALHPPDDAQTDDDSKTPQVNILFPATTLVLSYTTRSKTSNHR